MIVHTMTYEQMAFEILEDLRAFDVMCCNLSNKNRRNKNQINKWSRVREWKSPRGNIWLFKIKVCKHYFEVAPGVIFHDQKRIKDGGTGLIIISPENFDYYLILTSHLFKRYNERLGLNILSARERVKHLFDKIDSVITQVKILNKNQAMTTINDGVLLGEAVGDWAFEFKTFIRYDQLKKNHPNGDQIEALFDLKGIRKKI